MRQKACRGVGSAAQLIFYGQVGGGQDAPHKRVGQAYLAVPVVRHAAIIPHLMLTVPHQAAARLYGCDTKAAQA